MKLAVFVQLPVFNRYTENWIDMWSQELSRLNVDFEIFGNKEVKHFDRNVSCNYFTDTAKSIIYECSQISAFATCIDEFTHLLVLDADFPGMVASIIPTFKLMNKKLKCYTYLHAGSYCKGDVYTITKQTQTIKKHQEYAMLKTYDKIFVASKYHKSIIKKYFNETFNNIIITGMPIDREWIVNTVEYTPFKEKEGIFIAGRIEQCNRELIDLIKEEFADDCNVYDSYNSPIFSNRLDFLNFVNKRKVVVSIKTEDTFGLIPAEASILGSFVLIPAKHGISETLKNKDLLYYSDTDMLSKLSYLVEKDKNPYKIDWKQHDNAIRTIMEEMIQ